MPEVGTATTTSLGRAAGGSAERGAEHAIGVGVAEFAGGVEAAHEVEEVGQAFVAGAEGFGRGGEDLAPVRPRSERRKLTFDEADHGEHRSRIGDPGEVEGHAVLA